MHMLIFANAEARVRWHIREDWWNGGAVLKRKEPKLRKWNAGLLSQLGPGHGAEPFLTKALQSRSVPPLRCFHLKKQESIMVIA
jgi:hypothetical protein